MLWGMMSVFFLCQNSSVYAGENLHFDSEGNLKMTTYDKIATSDITYRTLGWTIKKNNKPRDAEGNFYAVIRMEQNGDVVIDPENPDYRYSEFICDKDVIFSKIGKASEEWQETLYTHGGKVYLDAIMTVCIDGEPRGSLNSDGSVSGEVYFDFDGIAGAQPWADKEPLRTHFDKEVEFSGNPALLLKDCSYVVRHYEYFQGKGTVYPLSRYGKNSAGKVKAKKSKTWNAADLSAYDFQYVEAKIVKHYKDGTEQAVKSTDTSVTFTHNKQEIVSIEVLYYYSRKEQTEERVDTYHLKDGKVQSESAFSIAAGEKGKEDYDVLEGVPSGEKLYIDGSANQIAYTVTYERHYGYKTLPVEYTSRYTYKWVDDEGKRVSEPVFQKEMYYVDRCYSYWKIKSLVIYTLDSVEVYNYGFEKEKVRLTNIYLPHITVNYRETYVWRDAPARVYGNHGVINGCGDKSEIPKGVRQGNASAASVYYKVANDTFSIDDEVFLAGNALNSYTGNPMIGSDNGKAKIYNKNLVIPVWKRNGKKYPSKAVLTYKKYDSKSSQKVENASVNPVTIHTPVVCSGFVTDEKELNQLCFPDDTRKSLILGREFEIYISAKGTHIDKTGYGNRDYGSYVKAYQVKFPFEVYRGDSFYARDTWIEWKEDQVFYLPTGVEEGKYTISVRTLAYNYKEGDSNEKRANKNIANYAATDGIEVYVCGRLYGLRIDNIIRTVWRDVFYYNYKKTNVLYTIGLCNLNGEKIKEDANQTFPILRGGNPKAVGEEGEPLGTEFYFTMETIGNYSDDDSIEIEAEFYVVDETGGNRKRVDIYQFMEKDGKSKWYNLRESSTCGMQVLKKKDRSNIGSCERNVLDDQVAGKSVARWRGTYKMPEEIYVVPYGTDVEKYIRMKGHIDLTDEIFLRRGYLMVQFNIWSVKGEQRYLSYINKENEAKGYGNMWKIEGFVNPKKRADLTEFSLSLGDVFLYDLQEKITDSHQVMGTH